MSEEKKRKLECLLFFLGGNNFGSLEDSLTIEYTEDGLSAVLESPGIPVTGFPSILKGYHNSLIDGSPSILVSPMGSHIMVEIAGNES